METKQLDLWRSKFGHDYSKRNKNVIEENDTQQLVKNWEEILAKAVSPTPESVLEVGSNIGRNLFALKHFIKDINAIEPNHQCCEDILKNKELSNITIHEATGFDMPYADSSIDLVFTSGVLIHIHPNELPLIIDEIYRVSKHYLLFIEYFSHDPQEVPYHGMEGYLYKRDFGSYVLERHSELTVIGYGFFWEPFDAWDNCNWWLFKKP